MFNLLQEFKEESEKFNKDFISLKERDFSNLKSHLDKICKSLEVINNVFYKGCEIITNENEFVREKNIDVDISRLNKINLKFLIKDLTEEEEITCTLFFPKIIDKYYFVINDNNYFPIFQLVDKNTYITGFGENKAVNLKTPLMPITINLSEYKSFFLKSLDRSEEIEIKGKEIFIKIFSKNINFFYYYLAEFGLEETIDFFGFSDFIKVNKKTEDSFSFNISENFNIYIKKEFLDNNLNYNFLISLFEILNKTKNSLNIDYWKKKLGSFFTKNLSSQKDKSERLLMSFKRISVGFDKDIFQIIKWMIINFKELSEKDNMDLKNKKIRLSEYILYPLMQKFSDNAYRIFNSKTSPKLKDLKSLFRIKSNILLKKIIVSELLRYDNSVNGLELFSSVLKVSQKGPQSIISNGSEVPIKYRSVHPSYLGKISLTFSSANEPGLNMTFVPFIKIKEKNNEFYFEENKDFI